MDNQMAHKHPEVRPAQSDWDCPLSPTNRFSFRNLRLICIQISLSGRSAINAFISLSGPGPMMLPGPKACPPGEQLGLRLRVTPTPCHSWPLAATPFSVSVTLWFQEHYINGNREYVTFWDWLFHSAWFPSDPSKFQRCWFSKYFQ